MDHDRLGRKRRPEQDQGLRPLHPLLPDRWTSKAIRVAMSESDWTRFEILLNEWAETEPSPSQARAVGELISKLMEIAVAPVAERPKSPPVVHHWMDWERRKTLRLLGVAV